MKISVYEQINLKIKLCFHQQFSKIETFITYICSEQLIKTMKKTLLTLTIALAGFVSNAQYFSATAGADFQNFSILDADGDGENWGIYDLSTVTAPAVSSMGEALASFSYDGTAQVPLTPDNYIFSPVINLSAVTGTVALNFTVASPETTASGWYEEYLSVYVTDGLNSAALAQAYANPVHDEALTAGETAFTFQYNISTFAGADSLILIFEHHNCTDENFIAMDNITVTNFLNVNENVITASVYPNPTTDVLNIVAGNEEIETVTVASLDGKVVMNATSGTLDVADLKAGMYIYNVTTKAGKLATGNFVKN